MKITILPSDKGDCLFLESEDGTAILVDGGMPNSYVDHVQPFLGAWHKQHQRPLDLVYLSHIDQDHIAGVLQLMNDLVAWRIYRRKQERNEDWDLPKCPEPPQVKGIWHNGFHDMVEDNAGEIGSMLAARAIALNNSNNLNVQRLAAHYQAIAASIPESIKLSSRISGAQLKIPLNKEFGGKLAMVRGPKTRIQVNGKKSPEISVLGPFKDDLEKFKEKWNKWLKDKKNQANLTRTRDWRDREADRLDVSSMIGLDAEELGNRTKVTEENLASLMLLVRHRNKSVLLTGDGHYTDIIRGLEHNGFIKKGEKLHVDILKVPHHGSEHNLAPEFARQVTANHYVICGNGRHENPDLAVLDAIMESRIGTQELRSKKGKVGDSFQVWFNCSVKFLEREIKKRKDRGGDFEEYEKAKKHFEKIEKAMRQHEKKFKGRLKTNYLDRKPLEVDLG